jgi:predicted GNAT superfamily acetyltransferase
VSALTPAALGFTPIDGGWQQTIRGRTLTFRQLRDRAAFAQVERLQREVFGIADRDLTSATLLVVMPKTGGDILGAYDGEELVGFLSAYGGYIDGRPRLVSDMLAVSPAWRGGLGFALKSLQAALALAGGFSEIVWTVDPLRAANARLNFERLGAYSREYLEDLYGADFAPGLYGGLPTDRLLVSWPIASPRVADRLLGRYTPTALDTLSDLPDYDQPGPARARLAIPADIDRLVAADPPAALAWRLRVRAGLEAAFSAGYAITGFAGSRDAGEGYLILELGVAGTPVSR